MIGPGASGVRHEYSIACLELLILRSDHTFLKFTPWPSARPITPPMQRGEQSVSRVALFVIAVRGKELYFEQLVDIVH